MKRITVLVAVVLLAAMALPVLAAPMLIEGVGKHPARLVDFDNPGWVRLDEGLRAPLELPAHFGLGALRNLGLAPEEAK